VTSDLGPANQPARNRRTYCNPVYDGYFADPFVLRWEDRYVAYGTGEQVDGRAFRVLSSSDLVNWTSVGGALDLPPAELGSDYWAPEVVHADGAWWLYYSVGHGDVGHHLRVARASGPLGPFTDTGVNLTPDETFAIDPHPFRDSDGAWYLYYARDVLDAERVGTQLAVAPLASMTTWAGPARTVLAPSADWQIFERQRSIYGRVVDWHTLEGPTVREHGGRYYCLYSGGSYLGEGYGVAWASAEHPLGPWTEPPAAPRLLATVPGKVRGPGHNSVVTTPGGTDMLVYHAWDEGMSRRWMCIDPLTWSKDGPTTPGPTWTEQRRPL
jgi:arabinan endo-1,5-alpha-L-arabinosidase